MNKAAVKVTADNEIKLNVKIDDAVFVIDGADIEKVKTINFAAIMKSSAYKKLAKDNDVIYVSVNEKGKIILSDE